MPEKHRSAPFVILTMPGEVDLANQAAVADRLLGALDYCGLVVADMTGTSLCDCSGMRMLRDAQAHARAGGSALRIVIPPGSAVTRALAILGMDRILAPYASVGDALSARPVARFAGRCRRGPD